MRARRKFLSELSERFIDVLRVHHLAQPPRDAHHGAEHQADDEQHARDLPREADAIADDVVHIIDTILTLRCPVCQLAFVDFDACALLQCRCGVKFCGFCLHPNATHDHVAECRENPLHGRGEQGVYVAQPEWERAQHQRKQRLVRAHLADATQEHRAAVLDHLRPHGIDIW